MKIKPAETVIDEDVFLKSHRKRIKHMKKSMAKPNANKDAIQRHIDVFQERLDIFLAQKGENV